MNTNEYDRYSTIRFMALGLIVLLFGFVVSAILWSTTIKFMEIHEGSFEKITVVDHASVDVLTIQTILSKAIRSDDAAVLMGLKADMKVHAERLDAHFVTLSKDSTAPVLLDTIVGLYNESKPLQEEVLTKGAAAGGYEVCILKLADVTVKIEELETLEYKAADESHHMLIRQIQHGVIGLFIVSLILCMFLSTLAVRIQESTGNYIGEIKEAQLLYKMALEKMQNPLILVERKTGRILDANPAASRIFGYENAVLLQMENTALSAEPEKTRANTLGTSYEDSKRLLKRRNGDVFPAEIQISRFEWKNKEVHIACITDVTERVAYEKQLIDAKEAAEAGEHSKSRFLANISHEIRTPMNGLLGALQLMDLNPKSDDQEQLIQIGIDSSQSLIRLLDDILDYSQIESGYLDLRFEPFSIEESVIAVMALFEPAAQMNGISLQTEVGKGISPFYMGDVFQIRRILINLMSNALKHTMNGFVRISVKTMTGDDEVPTIAFCVEDTGCGIKREDLNRVFNRFSQLDDSNTKTVQGVGLGLATVKELVNRMDGRVTVESTIHEGSKFTVLLPLKPVTEYIHA